MSIVTIRFLVDDWSVKSISFPFDTREEAMEFVKQLHSAMTDIEGGEDDTNGADGPDENS